MATGKEIAATTLEAYNCEGGYIWGQQGAEWTNAKQAALEKKYNSDPEQYASYKGSATYGKKWIGHRVWDCAGLCRWAAKEHGIAIHSGSNLIWNCDLKEKGALTDGMELPEGALVFTGTKDSKPHVGTYTGNGLVTEASGAKAGVIQSQLHGGKWKWYGLEKGVEYGEPGPSSEPAEGDDRPILRNGSTGPYVTRIQTQLIQRGYNLGKWGADGKFGAATEKAVRLFQQDWGLTVDGVVGPDTYKMLDSTPAKADTYMVTIRGLSQTDASTLAGLYPGAVMEKEGGEA